MAGLMRHRQTKGPETDRPRLNHRATSRLYRNYRREPRMDADEDRVQVRGSDVQKSPVTG